MGLCGVEFIFCKLFSSSFKCCNFRLQRLIATNWQHSITDVEFVLVAFSLFNLDKRWTIIPWSVANFYVFLFVTLSWSFAWEFTIENRKISQFQKDQCVRTIFHGWQFMVQSAQAICYCLTTTYLKHLNIELRKLGIFCLFGADSQMRYFHILFFVRISTAYFFDLIFFFISFQYFPDTNWPVSVYPFWIKSVKMHHMRERAQHTNTVPWHDICSHSICLMTFLSVHFRHSFGFSLSSW